LLPHHRLLVVANNSAETDPSHEVSHASRGVDPVIALDEADFQSSDLPESAEDIASDHVHAADDDDSLPSLVDSDSDSDSESDTSEEHEEDDSDDDFDDDEDPSCACSLS
jgi:hypothetical protein